MVTSYVSGLRFGMVKMPAELVAESRVRPVLTDFTLTLAPETTAPLASLIVPVIWPVSVWPKAQIENSARIASKEINLSVVRFIALSASTEFEGGTIRNRPATGNAREWPLFAVLFSACYRRSRSAAIFFGRRMALPIPDFVDVIRDRALNLQLKSQSGRDEERCLKARSTRVAQSRARAR